MNNLKDYVEFISMPYFSNEKETKTYNAFYPIVMFDGVYDPVLGFERGESIRLDPVPTMKEALEAAKAACISTPNAIGFMARGVENV